MKSVVEGTIFPFFADRQEGWHYGVLRPQGWSLTYCWRVSELAEGLGGSLGLSYKVDTHTSCHQVILGCVTETHSWTAGVH